MKPLLLSLAGLLVFSSLMPAMPSPLDYTYGFWLGNWRRAADKTEPDFLCIESGRYGLKWNMQNPRALSFGMLNDHAGYLQAAESGLKRLNDLPAAELEAEVRTEGRVFKMKACRAGLDLKNETALANVWLWESGRIAQHYEMRELRFEDAEGNVLSALASMALVAWPQSLAFTLDVRPEYDCVNGPAPGCRGNGFAVRTEPFEIPHTPELDSREFTVACRFLRDERARSGGTFLFGKNDNENRDGYFAVTLARFGKISALMNIGGGSQNIHKATAQIPQLDEKGEWHHAALSYDGATMSLHVDGKLVSEKEIGLERQPGEGVLRFGRPPGDAHPCLQAVFDEVRVWNRALTSDEIAAVSKCSDKPTPRENLVFEQTFDELPAIAHPIFKDAILTLRLKTANGEWYAEHSITGDWTHPRSEKVTLRCDLPGSTEPAEGIAIKVLASGNQTVPSAFEAQFNAFLARANFSRSVPAADRLKRPVHGDKNGFGNYDDFLVEVENTTSQPRAVPFLLEILGPASITGLVPILCEPDGTPTGIPVQLSKNWHHPKIPNYLRAYTLLPAAPGKTSYLLRVAYAFYGILPSASLAQLSLVGWGETTNGRWDQLAIGSWGETLCLNPEFSASTTAITDIRALFTRDGEGGKKWQWYDAGWGADWLSVQDSAGKKLTPGRMKASYLSHGPCLPEVVYRGSYGANGEVELTAAVSTPRTDDHAKVFFRLRYDFRSALSAKDAWLFRLGRGHVFAPKISLGNREGLIKEFEAPTGLKVGELLADRFAFTGAAPWWLGFPGSKVGNTPSGSRGLVIRSFRANFSSKSYDTPLISLPVGAVGGFVRTDQGYEKKTDSADSLRHVDAAIVPPSEIETFQPGDSVEMEIEIDVVPVDADDYYGPNEEFWKHLEENPASWKTFHRAASLNNLQVEVEGGTLLRRFPIIVKADPAAKAVHLKIQGGTGAVAVRFEGLDFARGYELGQPVSGTKLMDEYLPVMAEFAPSIADRIKPQCLPLDQGVTGNDFWETSHDPITKTYTRTYNIPLDGKQISTWILKKVP
jgi:hypothetical protein